MEESLIDIDEVDDTLLDLDSQTLDFSLTPLQIPKSKPIPDQNRPIEGLNDGVRRGKVCFSPLEDMDGKENVDDGNLEAKRSEGEPQHTKLRKKRGGFNLRKSIAWNRAFFTEEGVLNPLELSTLCGSHEKFKGGLLAGVPEEGTPSRPKGKGLGLRTLEENRISDLGSKSLKKDQKVRGRLLSKVVSPARENATQVPTTPVQALKGVSRSVLRGGCPRPPGSSSRKRLPTSSTTNITTKFSKIPKFPTLKPEPSSVAMTSRIGVLDAKRSKYSHNAQPVIEKNSELKGSSISTKIAPVCTSSSIDRSRKDMASVFSVRQATTSRQPPQVSKNSSKLTMDTLANKHTSTSNAALKKLAVSLPLTHSIDANMPQSGLQSTKPSGLRMPSPSLRLFDEPKASSLHGSRTAPPSNINYTDKSKSLKELTGVRRQHFEIEKIKIKEKERPQKSNNTMVKKSRSSEVSAKDFGLGNTSVNPESSVSSGSDLKNSEVEEASSGVPNMVKIPQAKESEIKSLHFKALSKNQDYFADAVVDERSSEQTDLRQPIPASDVIEEKMCKGGAKLKKNDKIFEENISVEESHEDNGKVLFTQTGYSEEMVKAADTASVIIVSPKCEDFRGIESVISNVLVRQQHILEDFIETDFESRHLVIEEASFKSFNTSLPIEDQELSCDLLMEETRIKSFNIGLPIENQELNCDTMLGNDVKDCNEIDNRSKDLHVEDAAVQSRNISLPVENREFICDTMLGSAVKDSNEFILLGSESSLKVSTDQHMGDLKPFILEPVRSSIEELDEFGKTTSKGINPQAVGSDGLRNIISLKETETNLSQNSKVVDVEFQHELEEAMFLTEDENAAVPENTEPSDDSEQNPHHIKFKPNAVPFSDEWLAALEAAGEDILTMKSGAVTNSPPDKSLPEPGPWSPVKKKSNQEIGPFDCTKKYTNLPPQDLC